MKYLQFHLGNKDYKVLQRFKPQIIFILPGQIYRILVFKAINNLIHSIIFFNNMVNNKIMQKNYYIWKLF